MKFRFILFYIHEKSSFDMEIKGIYKSGILTLGFGVLVAS